LKLPWLSGDPEVLAHAKKHLTEVADAAFNGLWATVEFQPDLFSPQKFAIGVVVAPPDGPPVFRLISDVSKFDCIYGKKIASHFDDYLKAAEYSLARCVKAKEAVGALAFETDNLQLSTLWATSGRSQEDVLARLFHEVVPLEPSDEKPERDFVSMDTEQVRRLVGIELKRIAGIAYEQVVVDATQTLLVDKDTGTPHQLDFNLRSKLGAGSVVSALYKTPSIVELNLLRADRDLRTYAGIRKLDDLAVFIMTPRQDAMASADFGRLSDLIDETSWRLEQGGLRVEAHEAAEPLARGILDWARLQPEPAHQR
jgi:hypothetical protein